MRPADKSSWEMSSPWYLYIVRCADNSLYTGITTDLERRIIEHNSNKRGAKYTRARRPVELVYQETFDNRSEVSTREAAIKKMTPDKKRQLIQSSIGSVLSASPLAPTD